MKLGDLDVVLDRVVAALPEGESRAGQREMAHAIAEQLSSEGHLVVRAGTGTGKSLAYLVPVALSGKRVVVATATKALQDQLALNDVPRIAEHLGRDLQVATLKGRSNYVCRQRLRETGEFGTQDLLESDSGQAATRMGEQVTKIMEWAEKTATGDRAELAIEPDPRVWSSLSVSSEECPGAFRCPSGGDCFAEAARQLAAEADVVIVNQHLLGADLASGGAVLPEFDVLIVDEAHELEDVLSSALGVSISTGRFRALVANARAALPGNSTRRGGSNAATLEAISDVATSFEAACVERSNKRLFSNDLGGLGEVIELARGRLENLERILNLGDEPTGEQSAERALLASTRLRADLQRVLDLSDNDVAWVTYGDRPTLEIAPLDVAALLRDAMFGVHQVVLTSATVPFGLAARLGADPSAVTELDVGSPFDYEHNGLLYCAAHLPNRRNPEALAAIGDELAVLIEAAGGRTLALFTSLAAMRETAEVLKKKISMPILVQGEASKQSLIDRFSADHEASLFATMGFWQGVDVPGATCSLVVIDRIPFPRPDDPLISARRDAAGAKAFSEVDLPRAATLLAQGAGRLIRTRTDRGVVAVLDSRLATASYRWPLVRALPPMRRTKERAEVVSFLEEIRDGPTTDASRS